MRLLTLGVNHKTAGVALREQLAIQNEHQNEVFQLLKELHGCSECAIVSTCNRIEFYLAGNNLSLQKVVSWLANYKSVDESILTSSMYHAWDEEAVQHVMRVASGLDSLVLGEPQVLGQLKGSYALAKEYGSLGSYLEKFFQVAFSVAKEVRTDTAIGANPVSIAYAAVNLAKHIFTEISQANVLIIGAGETAELLATHLHQANVANLAVANRTYERARLLADQFSGESMTLQQLPNSLSQFDIVISSTGSQLPLLGKGTVEAAIKRRKHEPMLLLDLAVPRDIEPEVTELQDVYLYSIDDLQVVVDKNREQRNDAAQEAERIIQRRSDGFMHQLRELDAIGTLTCFRRKVEEIREIELQAALYRLEKGESAEDVISRMSRAIINKLMHEPSLQIRKSGALGQVQHLEWVRQFFGLQMDSSDLNKPENLLNLTTLRNNFQQKLGSEDTPRKRGKPEEH